MDDGWHDAVSSLLDTPWTTFQGMAVTNLGPEVRWWSRRTGKERSWWCLCQGCAGLLTRNPHICDPVLTPAKGEPNGSAGRGVRPRPTDFEGELCRICGSRLGNE
jgi:hypothetical protein